MELVMDGMSMDLEEIQREKLQALFPECFVEGRLDIDKLLSLCGEYITDDFEKYEFKWKGKSECLRIAQQRSTATLRPCPEESVNWETTQNLYIEGDNLEVLKLLQTTYYRKVKMIYVDPPYNTGKDFIYQDDFADPITRYKEITEQTTKSNPESMGRFHTNWLNMMYPRLRLAVNLLRDDGIIFISIDDHEVDNLKKLCNEIFGEENFVACLVYDKNRKNDAKYFSVGHEYILVYFKSAQTIYDDGTIFRATKEGVDEVRAEFVRLRKLYDDDWRQVSEGLKRMYASWDNNDERKVLARYTKVDGQGPYRDDGNINWPGGGGPMYEVIHPITGKPCKKPISGWRYPTPSRLQEEIEKGHVVFGVNETTVPRVRMNLFDSDKEVMRSVHFSYAQTATVEFQKIFDNKRVFENPKSIEDIKRLIEYVTNKNDEEIILDFFSGSATTAHSVIELNSKDYGNRKFIMVQLPELCDEKSEAYKAGYKNICEIGKERIRRAGAKIGKGDVGFKVFRLDTSGLKTWDTMPVEEEALDDLVNRLNNMVTRVKPDRTEQDMVYEIMLKLGISLTTPVEELNTAAVRFYAIRGATVVFICLQPDITIEQVEAIAAHGPKQIVFGQDCFRDITAMSNSKLALRDRGIDLKFV